MKQIIFKTFLMLDIGQFNDKMFIIRWMLVFYSLFVVATADDYKTRVGSKNRMIIHVMEDMQKKTSLECVYYIIDSSNKDFIEAKLTTPFIVDIIDNENRR